MHTNEFLPYGEVATPESTTLTQETIRAKANETTPRHCCLRPSHRRSTFELLLSSFLAIASPTLLILSQIYASQEMLWCGIGLAGMLGVLAVTAFAQKARLASMTQHGLGDDAITLLEHNSSLRRSNEDLRAQLQNTQTQRTYFDI